MEFVREYDCLSTYIESKALGNFEFGSDESNEIEIVFKDTEDLEIPNIIQIDTLNFIKENSNDIAECISKFIYDEREALEEVYGEFNQTNFDGFPHLSNTNDVRKYISISTIYIHSQPLDGFSFFGLTGSCTWDSEHAFGIVLFKDIVVDFGGWDSAYSYYSNENSINQASITEIYSIEKSLMEKLPNLHIKEIKSEEETKYLKLFQWLIDKRAIYGLRSSKMELSKNDKIKIIQNLNDLNLCGKNIDYIPDEIVLLESIKYLDISINNLTNLPSFVSNLVNLEHLDISVNQIKEIPESFENLINLKSLIFHTNHISKLPKAISKMTKLESIDCSDNNINFLRKILLKRTYQNKLEFIIN